MWEWCSELAAWLQHRLAVGSEWPSLVTFNHQSRVHTTSHISTTFRIWQCKKSVVWSQNQLLVLSRLRFQNMVILNASVHLHHLNQRTFALQKLSKRIRNGSLAPSTSSIQTGARAQPSASSAGTQKLLTQMRSWNGRRLAAQLVQPPMTPSLKTSIRAKCDPSANPKCKYLLPGLIIVI